MRLTRGGGSSHRDAFVAQDAVVARSSVGVGTWTYHGAGISRPPSNPAVSGRPQDDEVLGPRRALFGLVSPALERLLRERLTSSPPPSLTVPERRVLQLVAAGLANGEIAERLVVAPATVLKHLQHLENAYRKLGVTNRLAAAVYALEGRGPADLDRVGPRLDGGPGWTDDDGDAARTPPSGRAPRRGAAARHGCAPGVGVSEMAGRSAAMAVVD